MHTNEELAPAVRAILQAADTRPEPTDRISVTPRSLIDAFATATADDRIPLIAEIKPTSPTTPHEHTDDPVTLAKAMVDGGAAALSVLTEPDHFGGSPETLEHIRAAVDVPILRKDFILREPHLDTVEADIILLIARFIDDLDGLLAAARDRGFQVLVETHTPAELQTALDADATYIGVNNRDLAALEVDLTTFEHVTKAVPPNALEETTLIAESGITNQHDVRQMRDAGADGLLVGSAIMNGPVRETTKQLTHVTT